MACTSCNNSKPCSNPTCGCKFKVDTSCITYSGADLGAAGFVSGDSLTTILTTLNEKFVDYGPGDYVTMTSEAPGANCQYGGIKYLLRNGQTHAIKSTQYLCAASNGLGSGTPNVLIKWGQDGQSLEDSIVSEDATQITVGGTLKVTGGNPGPGKVFTSDSQGVGSWETMSPYDLPISTNTILGGVIVGKNLSITTQGVLSLDMITDVTHAELVDLVGSDALEPGTYYRITDYETIYEQPDFVDIGIPVETPIIKTGPVQPIIVLALKNNILSEQAYQENYPADTIKYQLEYNTKRTSTPTKGRIYERVDEDNNRTDFDHRNVLFKRYSINQEAMRPNQFHFVSEGINLFHYPVANNCISSEHLIFKDASSYQYSNNYIGGNLKEGDNSFTYFDLPNIVIGAYYGTSSNNHILKCVDSTFTSLTSSTIDYVIGCTFYRALLSKLSICVNVTFFTPAEIGSSTITNWGSLFICSTNNCEIQHSEISNLIANNTLGLNPYAPFTYTDLGDIMYSKIGTITNIRPIFRKSALINVRDDSKMYTGTSTFSPNDQYGGIIVKVLGSDELVSDNTRVKIDSFGRVSSIEYFGMSSENGISTVGNNDGTVDVIFYFETTTSNELGKVPSNVIEQVSFSADKCAAPTFTASTVIYSSNIKFISGSSIGSIFRSNIDEINVSKIAYIEDSSGVRMDNVTSKTDGSWISRVNFKNLRDVTYSQIVNCTFNEVVGSNFGFYFGGPDENTSSDSWVFTSNMTSMTSKTSMVAGNIFNSDIINSNFGEYVQGNIFDCEVVDTNIPSYFSNNNIKALAYKYHNIDYLNKYSELKELPIKCEIDSYFKTMSEFGFSTTLGSTIPYDKLSIYTKFKIDLKLFRVEPNYISTVPRLWYVFIHQRLDPNPYLYDDTNFEQRLESAHASFSNTNPVLLNTSTAIGQSKNNTKKHRDLNINTLVDMTSDLDSLINRPIRSNNTFYNIGPDLTRMSIPTKDDLELIYSLNLTQSAETVWSSSEVDLENAWAFNFATGLSEIQPKNTSFNIIYIIDLVGAEALKFSYNTSSGPVVVNIDELT